MGKRVLILSSSPRKNGNSDTLCHNFASGAKDSGNEVVEIFINDKNINYCKACAYCEKHNGVCTIKDDMVDIIKEIFASDVIVFASPVYFYSISGQLKTFIDRLVAVYTKIKDKDIYYILTAAENGVNTFKRAIDSIDGLCDCLYNIHLKGMVCAGGVWKHGEINTTKYLKQAYDLGYAV